MAKQPNQVFYGDRKVMDISDSTVTPETLGKGETAYDKSGEKITGTMEFGGIDTSDATATAADLLEGTTAYVNGVKISGTIGRQPGQTITPGTPSYRFPAGRYLVGDLIVEGDTKLRAENIRAGVSIFGVTGTYEGEGAGGGPAAGDIVKARQITNLTLGSGFSNIRVSYGSQVVNNEGTLALGGTTGTVTVSAESDLDVVKGKYVSPSSTMTSTSTAIYYIPEDATITQSGSTYSKSYTANKANQMFILG